MRALITGSTGLLGGWLVREARAAFEDVTAVGGPSSGIDLADLGVATRLFERAKPDVIVHGAALSAIADCAREPDRARRSNVEVTRTLASLAAATQARFVHVSTDLVFGGEAAPYREDAPGDPTSVYGRTKLEAEPIARSVEDSVVARVALLFGPTRTKRRGFFDMQTEALRDGAAVRLFDDEWRTPLSLMAAAESLVAIARSSLRGIVHLGGPERMSRLEMGARLARVLRASPAGIVATSRTAVAGEPRPKDVSLDRALLERTFPGLARASFEDECARMMRVPPEG
ncbi:MAG: SDR family oxidoreductase [Deltaproteobacteria bacterium]|nr:SDR family oxidoreductase [Deltaproteobacteria bacterium]